MTRSLLMDQREARPASKSRGQNTELGRWRKPSPPGFAIGASHSGSLGTSSPRSAAVMRCRTVKEVDPASRSRCRVIAKEPGSFQARSATAKKQRRRDGRTFLGVWEYAKRCKPRDGVGMAVILNYQKALESSPLPAEFKKELAALFQKNGNAIQSKSRISTKAASIKTQQRRVWNIARAFVDLRAGGFKLTSPYALKKKHLEYLVRTWLEAKREVGTMENNLTYLRTIAGWMGKHDLVGGLRDYAGVADDMRRSYVATEDKSWVGKGIDLFEVIESVEQTDRHVGMTLRLCAAFGLRREEGSMLRPGRAARGDKFLSVSHGTKGGRPRNVPIEFEWQYDLLERAHAISHAEIGSMIPPGYTPKTWTTRFSTVLRKHGITKAGLGVTTHGLRHGFAQELYARLAKVPAAVKRGDDRPDLDAHADATATVVEALGHSRASKSNAYLSSFRYTPRAVKPTLEQVETALVSSKGNKAHAALALGISRQSLYRILDSSTKESNP